VNDLRIFDYAGVVVRTVISDGEPWFVAKDVCDVLGISKHRDAVGQLDDDERSSAVVDTPGGRQSMTVVSEPGVYALMLISRSPKARAFQRWITGDVVPSIRRTGSYSVPETREQLLARAVLEASAAIAEKDERIAVLTPRAEAWDEIASAEGDYSVGDAAKMLARAGVETGPQRLFDQLADLGWTFRGHDGKWRAYADKVSDGYLAERPQSHHHPRTGELVVDAPQVRITLRGVERLRVRLGALLPAT
jgi:anti-repressor protein